MIDSRYWRWEHATAGQEHYNDNDHNNLMTKTVIMMMTVTMMMTCAQYRWWRHATAGPRPEILVTPHSHNHVRALRAILYKSTKYIAQRALSFTKKYRIFCTRRTNIYKKVQNIEVHKYTILLLLCSVHTSLPRPLAQCAMHYKSTNNIVQKNAAKDTSFLRYDNVLLQIDKVQSITLQN